MGLLEGLGIGLNARSTSSKTSSVFSLHSALDVVRELLSSPQFRDGVRLFTIGAAVSASKLIFDALLTMVKRVFIGEAIFRGRDESYRWILLFAMTRPSFQRSPRAVEVSARPTLLVDYQADYRGMLNETEIRATWSGVQEEEEAENNGQDTANVTRKVRSASPMRAMQGVHFFPATEESISFVFEGTRFWVSRQRNLVGDESWDESIKLSYLSLSSEPLRRVILAARDLYKQRSKGRVGIHRLDKYGNWVEAAGIARRSVDSIYLPCEIKDRLLTDAKAFLSAETRSWYSERGVPYRRGYLLYGVPGSGKSSMVHVLASESNRPIYTLNLAASSVDDETFIERMSEVPGGALLLIEDVDAAFVDRSATEEARKSKKGGISFSTLLNALDGVGAVEGRLLCMTTNHVDRLDPALIRPGRVDLRFEFHNASTEQAQELFLHWYSPRPAAVAKQHRTVASAVGTNVDVANALQEIFLEAAQFAENIPPDVVSVAAIQSFLLECGHDHQQAVRDVARWVDEYRRQTPITFNSSHNSVISDD